MTNRSTTVPKKFHPRIPDAGPPICFNCFSVQQRLFLLLVETGIRVFWRPEITIPQHFIEVVYSNTDKFNGGPIRIHEIYQHLGIAQIFFQETDGSLKQIEVVRRKKTTKRKSFLSTDNFLLYFSILIRYSDSKPKTNESRSLRSFLGALNLRI